MTNNCDLLLDCGWKFCLGEIKRFRGTRHSDVYNSCKAGGAAGRVQTMLEDNDWKDVRVPHDWMTALPYDPEVPASSGCKRRDVGWYTVAFDLPDVPAERARLIFEGVLGQTTVYVNGAVAGRNASGYNRFSCEIASYLQAGENRIFLRVDATEREGWSYEGAGLYRPARIEFRCGAYFDTDACFVRGEMQKTRHILADLAIHAAEDEADLAAFLVLTAPDGSEVDRKVFPVFGKNLPVAFPVKDAKLWSPEEPNLYRLVCYLVKDGRALDTVEFSVGLRSVEWRAGEGMFLNGRRYRVKGACCHQDHGGVGAAVTPELMEYRIRKLKSIGVNAYRCAHHEVPEALLSICDRLGMLVMVENRNFSVSQTVKEELRSLVTVSRNHPSVFLYSLFNEEPWQADRRGYLMAKEMRETVRALDPTRAVTAAMDNGTLAEVNASDALDVIGMNYKLRNLEATHERTPGKVILGTENCPTYATRGVYATDPERQVFGGYCDEFAHTFSESMTETMECFENHPYTAGCFVWSGFDGYGEPQPHGWPSIASHWGLFDLCGFEKDTGYLLAAWYKEELTVHLLPHWNHEAGKTVRVAAFTNGERAELFLNGRSLGVRPVLARRAEWEVPFEAGELSVVVQRGSEECTDTVVTAGAPARLTVEDVTPDVPSPLYRILNLTVTDEAGVPIPDDCRTVRFTAQGTEILGVCNGDPNGHHPQVSEELPLFHGRGQIIVAADGGSVTAEAEGLPAVTVSA